MPNIGYLNGHFLPLEEMKISPEDRGFQFGDGVYEVVRVYHGIPFLLPDHLTRLEQSAHEIRVPIPLTRELCEEKIVEGIRLSGYRNCKVYIQLTRGIAPREHHFPDDTLPTLMITFSEMAGLGQAYLEQGVSAITTPDLRWGRCDIKSLNLLPNVMAKQQAKESGAFEAIFLREGLVTEGATSNVMTVSGDLVSTPVLNSHILAGVTRSVVIDLAKKESLAIQERNVKAEELSKADEIFLVGTTIEVLPVTKVDGMTVGTGKPGPVANRLLFGFRELVG